MNNIIFDKVHHEFSVQCESDPINYEAVELPLSLIVQVTRQCNLKCAFCSESDKYDDPTISTLRDVRDKIKGTQRIYLSGGEPLMRNDIFDIIDMFKETFDIVGLPTNCIKIDETVCKKLVEKISYINAGLDGPRNINDKYRGDYDKIINGLYHLRDSGIEVSLSTVILKETLPYLDYVVQIADSLNIVKVKMVIPALRGRAKMLDNSDFAEKEMILQKFNELKYLKNKLGWKPRIKFAFWDKNTEGYALLVYPNQKIYAWPVMDNEDCVEYIGNLKEESLSAIWAKYPYKVNHINKYVGITMNKA